MKKSRYNGMNVTGFEGGISCSAEDKHMKIKDLAIVNGEWEEGDDWDATWKGTMKVTYDGIEPLYFDVNVKGRLDKDEYWDEDEDGPKGKKQKVAVLDRSSLNCDDGWDFRDADGKYVSDEMYDSIYPTLDDLEKKVIEVIKDTDFKSSYVKEDDGWVMNARYVAEDDDGNILGEADTYEEAKTLGGTRIVDTMKDDEGITSAWGARITADEMMGDIYDEGGYDWDAIEIVFYDIHHLEPEDEIPVDSYKAFKDEVMRYQGMGERMFASRKPLKSAAGHLYVDEMLEDYISMVGERRAYRDIVETMSVRELAGCLTHLMGRRR